MNKKITKYVLLFLSINSLIHSSSYRNLSIINDYDDDMEEIFEKFDIFQDKVIFDEDDDLPLSAMAQDLIMHSFEKKYPILVDKKNLELILKGRKNAINSLNSPFKISSRVLMESLKKIIEKGNIPLENNKNRIYITEHVPEVRSNLSVAIYLQTNFFSEDWICFDCVDTKHILLVPRDYLKEKFNSNTIKKIDDNTFGLRISKFKNIQLPSKSQLEDKYDPGIDLYDSVIEYLEKKTQKDYEGSNWSKIFTSIPFDKKTYEYAYKWIFYLDGHGFFGDEEDEPLLAGMDGENFHKMLHFFNTNLRVKFLYFVSCFASEETLKFAYKPFTGLKKLHFPVASGATTENVVSVHWLKKLDNIFIIQNDKLIPKPPVSLSKFFTEVEQNKPIETFLNHITDTSFKANNIPLIKIGDIQAQIVNIKNKIVNINDIKITASIIDQKPIDIKKEKSAVIFNSDLIPIRINLHNSTEKELLFMKSPFIKELHIENLEILINDLQWNEDEDTAIMGMTLGLLVIPVKQAGAIDYKKITRTIVVHDLDGNSISFDNNQKSIAIPLVVSITNPEWEKTKFFLLHKDNFSTDKIKELFNKNIFEDKTFNFKNNLEINFNFESKDTITISFSEVNENDQELLDDFIKSMNNKLNKMLKIIKKTQTMGQVLRKKIKQGALYE